MARPVVPTTTLLGAGRLAVAVTAARRFHLDGSTKVQIAKELGISRFKVARLLEIARDAGLVQIHVGMPPEIDESLSQRLREAFGLQYALAITGPDQTRVAIGRTAAGLVEELTSGGDVVGLAPGRTMTEMVANWSDQVPATFVQLGGALIRPDVHLDAPALTRRAAAAAGGTATVFYAPLILPDASSASMMREQVDVRGALSLMDRLTRAVVSVGGWSPGRSTVHDALDAQTQAAMRELGVVGELTGLLLAADGSVVDALADRVVGVSEQQLRATPQVVALASESSGADAITATLRSGLVDALVVPADLARQVLEPMG